MTFLYPPMLLNRLNPLTVGLALCWQSSLVVLFGYLLILPFAMLGGMNLAAMTLSYLSDIFPALSPVAEVLLSHWLFYSYFHYIVESLVGVALQGSTLSAFTLLALSLLVIVFGAAVAGGLFVLSSGRLLFEYFLRTELHDQPVHCWEPALLTLGWTHGHHPPILYE